MNLSTKRPDQCTYETNSRVCENPRATHKIKAFCEGHQDQKRVVCLAFPDFKTAVIAETHYRRQHYRSHIWQERFVIVGDNSQPTHFFEGTLGVTKVYEAHRYEDALEAARDGEGLDLSHIER